MSTRINHIQWAFNSGCKLPDNFALRYELQKELGWDREICVSSIPRHDISSKYYVSEKNAAIFCSVLKGVPVSGTRGGGSPRVFVLMRGVDCDNKVHYLGLAKIYDNTKAFAGKLKGIAKKRNVTQIDVFIAGGLSKCHLLIHRAIRKAIGEFQLINVKLFQDSFALCDASIPEGEDKCLHAFIERVGFDRNYNPYLSIMPCSQSKAPVKKK